MLKIKPKDIVNTRNKLGFSAQDYAKLFNVTPACICNWERGVNKPSRFDLVVLIHLNECVKHPEHIESMKTILRECPTREHDSLMFLMSFTVGYAIRNGIQPRRGK